MSRPLKQEKKEFSKINFSHNLKFPYLSSNLRDEKASQHASLPMGQKLHQTFFMGRYDVSDNNLGNVIILLYA